MIGYLFEGEKLEADQNWIKFYFLKLKIRKHVKNKSFKKLNKNKS